jgi:hypothetical protein
MVLNLKTWRDSMTFHKDEREPSRKKPFEEDYPLTPDDIEKLLDGGWTLLNRYSQYYDTALPSRGCHEWRDFKFLFEALR